MGADADTSSAPTAAEAKAASSAAGADSARPRGAPARWLAPIAGVLAALSGAGVLLGWALGLDVLTRPLGPVTVKANAALSFLALGFALWALARPIRRRGLVLAGKGAALGVGALAVLTLSQYVFGYDLGVDQALVAEPPSSAGTSVPGRMAPNTAACVALLAAALLVLDRRSASGRTPATGLAVAAIVIAYVALLGYAAGVEAGIGSGLTQMAVVTATALTVLGHGVLWSRPERSPVRLVLSDTPGGTVARALVPTLVAVPLVFEGMQTLGVNAGSDDRLVDWIFDILFVAVLIPLAWRLARYLDRSHERGARAERVQATTEMRYEALVESTLEAVVSAGADGRIIYANPAASELFGYAAGELVGLNLTRLMPERYRASHEAGMRRFLDGGEATVIGKTVELAGLTRAGEEFPLELSLGSWSSDEGVQFTGIIRDITARRRARQRRAVRDAAARPLAEARTLHEALPAVLDAVVGGLGWRVGAAWMHEPWADRLRLREVSAESDALGDRFAELNRDWSFARGEGLVGGVWGAGRSAWSPDSREDERCLRAPISVQLDLRGTVSVPVRGHERSHGTLEFFSGQREQPDDELLDLLETVGVRLGQFVERREAQRALEESELQHRVLVENLPGTAVMVFDRDLRYTLAAGPALSAASHGGRDLEGKTIFDVLPAEEAEALAPAFRAALDGQRQAFEYGSNGRCFWVQIVPLPGHGGIVAALDITERKTAEGALGTAHSEIERQQRFVAALLENLAEGVVACDADGKLALFNRSTREFHGVDDEALPPEQWSDRYSLYETDGQTPLAEHAIPLYRAFEGEQVRDAEMVIASKQGSPRTVLASGQQILGPDGERLGAVVSMRDVTEQKRTERQLARARDEALDASRAKSAFLANMSHEIRTPMNGVIGMTELLLDTPLERSQRAYAETVRTSADSLLAVINDVLDLSRIEAGRLELEHVAFEPETSAEDVCDLLAAAANGKGLELFSNTSPSLPALVRGDPGRVRQVLLNLVSNAIKFTEAGEVSVDVMEVERSGGEIVLRFEVSDTGVGIEPTELERLSEPFSQADASTTREYGGTGLGLAISKQLVEAMGGELGADGARGRGSRFWFTVRTGIVDASPPSSPAQLRGRRVLIVDDNATNRRMLEERLALWGMTTASAQSGTEALELVPDEGPAARFDVALLDFHMPDMDGLELARRLNGHAASARVPLVLLTSAADQAQSARRTEVAGYATKPLRQARLREELVSALEGQANGEAPDAGAASHDGGASEPQAATTTLPILVAEDNPTNQAVAVKWLERLGFRAETASDGREALDALDRRPFAAVLMDCQMPRLDGYETTRELRRRENGGGRTAVIAMTAHAMHGDRERCLEAGMDDYMAKPLRPDTLRGVLERWVPTDGGANGDAPVGAAAPAVVPVAK